MFFKRNKNGSDGASFYIYYGFGQLESLRQYQQVVLQPAHYSSAGLAALKAGGTQPLAYLSLGEYFAESAEQPVWQRPARNEDWDTHYVQAGHPAWRKHVRAAASAYLAKGFEGLFLDTVEMVDVFPEDRPAMLNLIHSLRKAVGTRPLIVNRGFSLLPELSALVDAVLFEGFSTRWTAANAYEALSPDDLEWTRQMVRRLHRAGLKVYALDYSASPELSNFARRRAATFGLEALISNRDLTEI